MRIAFLGAIAAAACGVAGPPFPPARVAALVEPSPLSASEQDPPPLLERVDPSVQPCRDFYGYACGGWLSRTTAPARGRVRLYDQIEARTEAALGDLLDTAAADLDDELGRWVRACRDTDRAAAAGLSALRPLLAAISGAHDHAGLLGVVGELHRAGVDGWFRLEVFPRYDQPEVSALWLWQSPAAPPSDAVRRLLGELGEPVEEETLAAAAAVERDLFDLARSVVAMRRLGALDRAISREALARVAPGVPWREWLDALAIPEDASLVLAPPSYFAGLGAVLAKHDLDALKASLRIRLLATHASELQALGQSSERARYCVAAARRDLGPALDRRYLDTVVEPARIEGARALAFEIAAGFGARLDRASWLDQRTRRLVREKLAAIRFGIGSDGAAPVVPFAIGPEHLDNVLGARGSDIERDLRMLGRPYVDRWSATRVVASSSNARNLVIMPAAYIQPPHDDPTAPVAARYGAIGTTLGHEIAHLFDDRGRLFDAAGRLEDGWSPDVASRFERRAGCLRAQYEAYEATPGAYVNGELTLGENIAELSGVEAAHVALERWASEQDIDLGQVDEQGLTPDRIFFIAYGQTQCTQYAEGAERAQLEHEHAPARARINGTLSNVSAFRAAFACEPGTPMHPVRSCEVW